jgi:nicotinamidase-related amidase
MKQRIQLADSIAVLVDVQQKLMPHIAAFEQLESNLIKLLTGLRVLNVPLLVTEQYTAGLGVTIPSLKEVLLEDYSPIEKMTFSCCGNSHFLDTVAAGGKPNVIIMGIETHVCVAQTVFDLLNEGYQPVVIADCTGSRKITDKEIALERMRQAGAIITSYEAILLELCVVSGTDIFKRISKIIK